MLKAERGHLVGDVPAMILVAIVLAFLASREVMPGEVNPVLQMAWL
jgi:hypothetical protein